MKLNRYELKKVSEWQEINVKLPDFSVEEMISNTKKNPTWIHFGAGNIFRGFIAKIQQNLLNEGLVDTGIIACDTFDYDIINKIYKPFDDLTMLVSLLPNGDLEKEIIGSIGDSIAAKGKEEIAKLKNIFQKKSLQMVSFTITEKGYSLYDMNGDFLNIVKEDIANGLDNTKHAMSTIASLLYSRYQNGGIPVAMVSMDNCSHNGDKLSDAILMVAKEWNKKGIVDNDFLIYLSEKVSFPWSMIDKITPRPDPQIQNHLKEQGIENMEAIITERNTFIAPFVNAEVPQYLVIEDSFPNGRPPLEQAGVYLTDRETVNNTERMKVTTCLNPLHTALAVFGCLLGYTRISDEMKDEDLKNLVEKMGYLEGMKVVVDPLILDPKEFIKEVLEVRLPNPFIPDMPQRIATDTSQKIAIRFGETIKSYMQSVHLEVTELVYIPLVLAAWLRYLLALDDNGKEMELSTDPMLEALQDQLKGIEFGNESSYNRQLLPILKNKTLFGEDLVACGLAPKIEELFCNMISGKGSVRSILHQTIKN